MTKKLILTVIALLALCGNVLAQPQSPPSFVIRVPFASLPTGVGSGTVRTITNSDGTGCNGNGAQDFTCQWNGGAWVTFAGGTTGSGTGDLTEVQANPPLFVTSGTGPIPILDTNQLVNAQTGTTYTYLDGDKGKLVTHSNAAAIAATLPNAAGAGFDAGWFMDVQNRGAGTLTITPTTSTIDGLTSLVLPTRDGARIVSDGTNYFTQRGKTREYASLTVSTFGDSITTGTGASPASSAYVPLVAAAAGWTVDAQAVSGSELANSVQDNVYQNTITTTWNSITLFGYNDARHLGTSVAGQSGYEGQLRAALTWLAIPATSRRFASDASLTKTGTWTGLGLYSSAINESEYSTTQNDTISFTAEGSAIYIGYTNRSALANGGVFSVTVDGVVVGSVDTNVGVTPVVAETFWPALYRIGGLTNGKHTVVITITSTTGSFVQIEWVGSNVGYPSTNGPTVFAGNTLRMNPTGYALGSPDYNNGSDAVVRQFNEINRKVATELASDGLRVVYVDASQAYDPDGSDVDADNIHPNNSGHAKIANAFLAAISQFASPIDKEGSRWALALSSRISLRNDKSYTDSITSTDVVGTLYFSEELTNIPLVGIPSFTTYSLNPSGTVTNSAFYNHSTYTTTKALNAQNWPGSLIAGHVSVVNHGGSGTVAETTAVYGDAGATGGTVTDQSAGQFRSVVDGGTITNNRAIVAKSGSFTGGGTLINDYTILIREPYSTGTATNHYGLYIQDQSILGSTLSYSIYTDGTAPIRFGGSLNLNTLTASRPVITDASKNLASGTYSGNTTEIGTTAATKTTGMQVQFDASGNLEATATPIGGAGSGDNITVNGVAAVDADFDDATPAAPASAVNVKWQKDALTPNNVSAHLLLTDIDGAGLKVVSTELATDSTEADFLTSGALTCGLGTQGKIQVHTTPLQYCDNAATPTLQYAAYGNSSGVALTAAAVAVGGITGLGTGVATALAVNVGSAGAFVTFNGDAGTPSALVGTNITGTAAGLTAGTATALATSRTIGGSSFDGSANVTSFPSPGAIGGTTPAAATFTTVTADSYSTTGTSGASLSLYEDTGNGTNFRKIGVPAALTQDLEIKIPDGNPAGSVIQYPAPTTGVSQGAWLTFGTGVATALAVNVGSAGAFVTFNGDAGTPSALVGTNITGTAASLTAGAATVLAADPTDCLTNQFATAIAASGNLTCAQPAASNLSDGTTGSGNVTLATAPTISSPVLSTKVNLPRVTAFPGTPSAGDTVIVTDDSALGACDSAAGSATTLCQYDGAAWVALGDGATGSGITSLGGQTGATQTITFGAGIAGISSGNDHSFRTASEEAGFLADGGVTSLTCGGSNQGKMQVLDNGDVEWCDGATTSVLQTALRSGGPLGTPSGGTLTNATGLPIAGLTASTSTAIGVGSVELGHASDTTIARVGAGQISVEGVNVVTTSSTDTLTNKTLDAEGTGNTITIPFETWYDVAGCDNATAGHIWNTPTANAPAATCDTGTNTQKAYLAFDATTDESIQGSFVLPAGFTGAIDIKLKWKAAAITGSVAWCMQLVRVPDGATSDPAFPAQATGNCVSDAAKGTTLQENDATISNVTCTSCAAGDTVYWRLSRDPDETSTRTDDMTGDALLLRWGKVVRAAL